MHIQDLIREALDEDLGQVGDLTTDLLIPPSLQASAKVVAKSSGVLCGVQVFVQVCRAVDPLIVVESAKQDGEGFANHDVIVQLQGSLAGILKAERTALNFMGRLSGVASLARTYMDKISHTKAVILDTRKTTPGLRSLEKYAVYCGGASNHRRGLWDMILVKENHLAAWKRPLSELMPTVREKFPRQVVEVEVQSLDQLRELLINPPQRVLLDHFSLEQMRQAVALVAGTSVQLEASGNVSLETVKAIAETGVDFISVGALTHSAPCSDFSLLVDTHA